MMLTKLGECEMAKPWFGGCAKPLLRAIALLLAVTPIALPAATQEALDQNTLAPS